MDEDFIPEPARDMVTSLSDILSDETKTTEDVFALNVELSKECLDEFWSSYKKLPIVNPTKWKFHETVFEEHYYQMLRLLSYELERPNSVLITFGFSFADEHILNLVSRSLSNPRLQVYVCCFNRTELNLMKTKFSSFRNVKLISMDEGVLDFSAFNEYVFDASVLKGEM